MKALSVAATSVMAALLGIACTPAKAPGFPLSIVASVDGDAPLSGVGIGVRGRSLGRTDAAGRLTATVFGKEGERLPLTVVCPAAFRGPEKAPVVRLSRVRPLDEGRGVVTAVTCRPRNRALALVIVANRGAHVPIVVDGAEAQTTDEGGVAHVLVERPPNSEVRVAFDTTAQPNLIAPGPLALRVDDEDRTLLLDEKFELRPSTRRPRRYVRERAVPYRIR